MAYINSMAFYNATFATVTENKVPKLTKISTIKENSFPRIALEMLSMAKRYVLLFVVSISFVSVCIAQDGLNQIGIKTVVIDAGHGGHDVGCLGASSQEKNVALAIALKLGEAIEKNYPKVKVVYTRKTDVFVTLQDRAKIANENAADLFICVHANANDNKSAYGTETFVMGLHKSEANLNVAKRENSSILMEDNYDIHYEGFDPSSDESYIALSLMQSTHLTQSLIFASKTQKQFKKLGRKDRGVKQAGFLVLYRTAMPSVLIETGFLTNKEEEAFLKSPENQKKMAEGIFEAFKSYKAEIEGVKITETPEDKKKEKVEVQPMENDESKLDVVYRVQIASSSNKITVNSSNFNGFNNVWEYQQNGMFKYALGGYQNLAEASEMQMKAREKGYKDAFVVAFYRGDRISMSKARELNK